jgi:hypothetical protein
MSALQSQIRAAGSEVGATGTLTDSEIVAAVSRAFSGLQQRLGMLERPLVAIVATDGAIAPIPASGSAGARSRDMRHRSKRRHGDSTFGTTAETGATPAVQENVLRY